LFVNCCELPDDSGCESKNTKTNFKVLADKQITGVGYTQG